MMSLFFIRRCISQLNDFYRDQQWRYIIIATICLYFGVYFALMWAGEDELVANYRYFFAITSTTIGFGDFSPKTTLGKDILIVFAYTGLIIIATLIGKISAGVYNMSQRKNLGMSSFNERNHILIMGYDSRVTPGLIIEILGDTDRENRKIILCSSSLERNPFPDKDVDFVKGELDSSDVHKRSCATRASKVIVCGRDDGQSFLAAFAFRQVNSSAHLVVHLHSSEHATKVAALPANNKDLNQSILPASTGLIVQEMQDPQSSNVLQQLMSNLDGATIYRLDIPSQFEYGWNFGKLFSYFRSSLNATIIAIKDGDDIVTNPSLDMRVNFGMSLFYIGEKRERDILWKEIA